MGKLMLRSPSLRSCFDVAGSSVGIRSCSVKGSEPHRPTTPNGRSVISEEASVRAGDLGLDFEAAAMTSSPFASSLGQFCMHHMVRSLGERQVASAHPSGWQPSLFGSRPRCDIVGSHHSGRSHNAESQVDPCEGGSESDCAGQGHHVV